MFQRHSLKLPALCPLLCVPVGSILCLFQDMTWRYFNNSIRRLQRHRSYCFWNSRADNRQLEFRVRHHIWIKLWCIQWFTLSSGDTWNITTAAEKQRYVDFVKTKPTSIIALNHDVHQQTAWVPSPRRILIIITLNFILGEPAKSCSLSQSKHCKLQAINSLLWPSALVNRPINRLLHLRLEMYACLVSNIHFYGVLIGI